MDVALELNVDKKPIYIMLCPAGEEHFQGQQMAEYFMLLSTTAPLPPPHPPPPPPPPPPPLTVNNHTGQKLCNC